MPSLPLRHVALDELSAPVTRLPLDGATNDNSCPWAKPASSDQNAARTPALSIACMAFCYPVFRRVWYDAV